VEIIAAQAGDALPAATMKNISDAPAGR